MSNLEREVEALKDRYYAAKSQPLYTSLDTDFSRITFMNLCSQALNLLDKALHNMETPPDKHFVGDEGIK